MCVCALSARYIIVLSQPLAKTRCVREHRKTERRRSLAFESREEEEEEEEGEGMSGFLKKFQSVPKLAERANREKSSDLLRAALGCK